MDAYPSEISNDYLGGRGGSSYPNLSVSAARKRLGLLPKRQPPSYRDSDYEEDDLAAPPNENEEIESCAVYDLFCSEAVQALASREIPIVNATHSNVLYRQALLEILSSSVLLLPAVKRVLAFGVQVTTSDGLTKNKSKEEEKWTQGKRFLWHALETLVTNALYLDGVRHRRAQDEMEILVYREAWFSTGDRHSTGDASGHPYASDGRRIGRGPFAPRDGGATTAPGLALAQNPVGRVERYQGARPF